MFMLILELTSYIKCSVRALYLHCHDELMFLYVLRGRLS